MDKNKQPAKKPKVTPAKKESKGMAAAPFDLCLLFAEVAELLVHKHISSIHNLIASFMLSVFETERSCFWEVTP